MLWECEKSFYLGTHGRAFKGFGYPLNEMGTTAYAATPSEEALLAHYLSYEEDPDSGFSTRNFKAYDKALPSFLKAGMLLELKGKKINSFTAPLFFAPYLHSL